MTVEETIFNHVGLGRVLQNMGVYDDVVKCMHSYADSNWILTKERNPHFGEPVFVWCRIYGRYIGTYEQIEDTSFGNWNDGKQSGVLPPIYWMPLPDPPNQ
jgi:hypothetical protein